MVRLVAVSLAGASRGMAVVVRDGQAGRGRAYLADLFIL